MLIEPLQQTCELIVFSEASSQYTRNNRTEFVVGDEARLVASGSGKHIAELSHLFIIEARSCNSLPLSPQRGHVRIILGEAHCTKEFYETTILYLRQRPLVYQRRTLAAKLLQQR